MKLPDGYVLIFESNEKGTVATVKKKELVTCKNCKNRNGNWLDCHSHENDFYCAYGERAE